MQGGDGGVVGTRVVTVGNGDGGGGEGGVDGGHREVGSGWLVIRCRSLAHVESPLSHCRQQS